MSTFSIRASLPILQKADAVAPGHRVGQPPAEFVGPIIGGGTFAQRCRCVAKRVDGATAAKDKNAISPQRCNSCTKRYVLRGIEVALDRELHDGDVRVGKHEHQRHPRTVVKATMAVKVAA